MAAEPEPDLPLEIAHLLFIDIVGYSQLLVDEQIEAMQQLTRVVRGAAAFREAETAEKMIRLPTGDGMVLLFFRSPEQPVRCALEVSAALRDAPQIKIRMGIHSGPVSRIVDVNDQANVAGAGMNIGQRVMDCGDAGHILLSKHVADDLAQYRHWKSHLHDLGECEVKHGFRLQLFSLHKDGLGNPAVPGHLQRSRPRRQTAAGDRGAGWSRRKLFAIAAIVGAIAALIALALVSHRAASGSAPDKSIAVLPFENRSADKANAYFADGIQDQILTRLSKIAELTVISRTSTLHYQNSRGKLSDVARQLGVSYILEGSVQKSGDAVRVNVQLIKAATDAHVWADTFDRTLVDIFSAESEIARTIADQLGARLTGREKQLIDAKPTSNPDAYDAYLRGLAYSVKAGNTTANALGAQRHLREAVRLDPKFALAWALLSYTDATGHLTAALEPTDDLREEARGAAETALGLQPDLGEAVLARGQYNYACRKDYDAAIRDFEQARRLLPSSSRVPESLAYVARRRGQWQQSEAYFKDAERLDPRNANILTQHALFYVALRRFPEALRKCEQILDIVPDDVDTVALQAGIAQAEGDLPRAAALLARLRPAATDTSPLQTQIYQAVLQRRPADIIPRLQQSLARPDPGSAYFLAQLRLWLGWAQQMTGDGAGAQQTWGEARAELERLLQEQPEADMLLGDLALISMALGDKDAALRLAERGIAANPPDKDAVAGPGSIEILARVAAGVGERDRAINALEKLLSTPYAGSTQNVPLTPALLRLDPMFDALREDPRFEKLVASPAAR
ncbi:MAG TPA: tetratricopeptide repeat protein [Chthoniobacterales bacterium]